MTVYIPGPIFTNTTLTSSGSVTAYTGPGSHASTLIINIANQPTGTSPTIQFTVQEVDISNYTTALGSPAAVSSVISAAGVYSLSYGTTFNGALLISWTVGGTTPSFTSVSVSLVESSGTDSSNRTLITGGIIQSTGNSTSVPLAPSTTFVGTGEDVTGHAEITVAVFGNPDGAQGTLYFEFGPDNVNWDVSVPLTVYSMNVFVPFPLRVIAKFFRVRYVNGSTQQTTFRLTTQYYPVTSGTLIRTPTQVIGISEPVSVHRALIEPSLKGHLTILGADRSISGEAVTLPYILQARAEFDAPFANNDVTVTQIGSATVAQASNTGAVLTSASAAGACVAKIVTNKKVRYRPGREFRMELSAGWPTPGLANTTQLYGLSDEGGSLNRLAIGYVGTTFGVHIYNGGTITTVPQSSWNGDSLDGSAFSEFTTSGIPVALDITKANAWRIRGVWFGVGPVYFEVRTPDDKWVVAHVLHYPNTATVPYLQSPNMFLFGEVTKTASAGTGTLSTFSFCWSGGSIESAISFEPHEINSRKQIQVALGTQTANVTAYTVSTGRQLFIKTFTLTCANSSYTIPGRLDVIDATSGSVGTLLHTLSVSYTNQSTGYVSQNITLPVPLVVLNGVRFIVNQGALTFSVSFQGYEKEI